MQVKKEFLDEQEGLVVSRGTLNREHLLERYLDQLEYFIDNDLFEKEKSYYVSEAIEMVKDIKLYLDFLTMFEDIMEYEIDGYQDEHINKLGQELLNEITDIMVGLAPEGYLFATQAGDGALIGFFKEENL